jgi:hypothetical protein
VDVLETLVEQTPLLTEQTKDRSGSRRLNNAAPVIAPDPFSTSLGVCFLLVLQTATRSDELDCEIVFRQELEAY